MINLIEKRDTLGYEQSLDLQALSATRPNVQRLLPTSACRDSITLRTAVAKCTLLNEYS